MSWYKSGSVTVTNGSTTVTGSGTSWIVGVGIGEAFYAPDGRIYEIADIVSATSLTLGSAYLGSTASGQTYQIIPTQSYIRDLAAQAAQLVADYAGIASNAGAGKFGDGTIASPGIQFVSDSNLGIRRAGTDDMRLVANGVDQAQITGSGTTLLTPSVVSVNSATTALRITQVGAGNALVVEDSANPDSSPFVIDASGRTLIGIQSVLTTRGVTNPLQVAGAGFTTASALLQRYSNDANSPGLEFNKTRATSAGVSTVVSNNDALGQLIFTGADGTDYVRAAEITAFVDGAPGTNDMPGRLVFSTTADGASSPTERMRIDSAGRVGIGSTGLTVSAVRIQTSITGGTTAYGVNENSAVLSDVTSGAYVFATAPTTQAASFTLSNLYHYFANQGTFGASSAVTNQYGFVANSGLSGATNNYGFYSGIASGTGRWNFYAAGTAANYFGGNVIQKLAASVTPANNSEMMIELTSNTSLTIKVKGTDGTVRSVSLTLA